MKDMKSVKIGPSSTTEFLLEGIRRIRHRGRIYVTTVVSSQDLSGPKYVFRTGAKDIHLDLGVLSEEAQLELAWLLERESEGGKSDLIVDFDGEHFIFCTTRKAADRTTYFTLSHAN